MIVNQYPDRKITVDNTKYLYFGGTSYLGINTHQKFQKKLLKNIKKWGTFYGSSRNSNIQLSVYDDFETHFAKFVKAEKALATTSGTLAGKLVLDTLQETQQYFYHYPKTHPAITTKHSKSLFVNNEIHPEIKSQQEIVICSDAILGGEVKTVDFSFLDDLPIQTKVTLVIDESHSIGILGKKGNGIFSNINHKNVTRKIFVSSLSKAFGISAGAIASDTNFIKKVALQHSFISSSGANPSHLQTFLDADNNYQKQQQRLQNHLEFLSKNLNVKEASFKFNNSYPVLYLQNEIIVSELKKKKILITNFKYPSYKNKMTRIVITANHKKKDLQKLINILNQF